MMIGNGLTNFNYDMHAAYIDVAYAHSLISMDLHTRIKENGCHFSMVDKHQTPICLELQDMFFGNLTNVNMMNLLDICHGAKDEKLGFSTIGGKLRTYKRYYTA